MKAIRNHEELTSMYGTKIYSTEIMANYPAIIHLSPLIRSNCFPRNQSIKNLITYVDSKIIDLYLTVVSFTLGQFFIVNCSVRKEISKTDGNINTILTVEKANMSTLSGLDSHKIIAIFLNLTDMGSYSL